jgi:hypothetical protein
MTTQPLLNGNRGAGGIFLETGRTFRCRVVEQAFCALTLFCKMKKPFNVPAEGLISKND